MNHALLNNGRPQLSLPKVNKPFHFYVETQLNYSLLLNLVILLCIIARSVHKHTITVFLTRSLQARQEIYNT